MTQIDASLRRIATDYVDTYRTHRWDPRIPIEETMEALHDLVKAGKARYLGHRGVRSRGAAWHESGVTRPHAEGVDAPVIGATSMVHVESAVASLST